MATQAGEPMFINTGGIEVVPPKLDGKAPALKDAKAKQRPQRNMQTQSEVEPSPYAMHGMGYPSQSNFPNPYMNPYMMSPMQWGGAMPMGMPALPGMPGILPPYGMTAMYPSMFGMPGAPALGSPAQHQKGAGKAAHDQTKSTRSRRRGKAKGNRDRPDSPANSDDPNKVRSPVLEEVRNCGTKSRLTIMEVLPFSLEFAEDQHGSKFLQAKLDDAGAEERRALFEAVSPESAKLASDAFGNALIQKLFDIGTTEQKKKLAENLKPEVLNLAKDPIGCRVVQKAIQQVPRESQMILASELKKDVISCIENMHGNHVIQKCIEQMPPDSVTFIIKAIEEQTVPMATNVYGCRVIQRLLEHCASHQLEVMLEKILEGVPALAQDAYGNYVVQHMLEHGRKEDKTKTIEVILLNVLEYSKHKCSSNVVEKCFEIATIGLHAQSLEAERQRLMAAVLGQAGDPNAPINMMMEDRYANYIVQRIIEHSKGPDRELLKQRIEALEPRLMQSTVGKHILEAKQKEFGS